MQTKFLTALCSLALVFSLASCENTKPNGNGGDNSKDNKLATPVLKIETQDYTSVTISWEAVENAAKYAYLMVGDEANREETTETSFTRKNLTAGEYSFRVQALAGDDAYTNSDLATITVKIEEMPELSYDDLVGTWAVTSNDTFEITYDGQNLNTQIIEGQSQETIVNIEICDDELFDKNTGDPITALKITGLDVNVPAAHLYAIKDEKTGKLAMHSYIPVTEPDADGYYYSFIEHVEIDGSGAVYGSIGIPYLLAPGADGTFNAIAETGKLDDGRGYKVYATFVIIENKNETGKFWFALGEGTTQVNYLAGDLTFTKTKSAALPAPKPLTFTNSTFSTFSAFSAFSADYSFIAR